VVVADDNGHAVLSFLSPAYLAKRYGIPPNLVSNIAGIEAIVDEVIA
jgi:hypothetical protein